MNCTHVRDRLPDLLYQDLPPAEFEPMKEHLAQCAACQSEYAALQNLRRTLDSMPPPKVSVNLATVYGRAGEIRAKRWRRAALAIAGLAAAVIASMAFRLEVRVQAEQVTIRWNHSTPKESIALVDSATNRATPPGPAEVSASDPELQPLRGLIYVLADDVDKLTREMEARDRRQQQAMARLQDRLNQLRLMFQGVALSSSKKGDEQ
jgi:Putative zinc-finger